MSRYTRIVANTFIFSITSILFAQVLTTGSINGVISGTNNLSLEGANVIANHIPSGTSSGATSRSDGSFNIPNLKVGGPYTVVVSYIGYSNSTISDIYISLGENRTIDFSLSTEAIEMTALDVVADKDINKTGAETRINNNAIQNTPTVSRGIFSITKQSSNVVDNNIAGRHPNYNSVKVDGAILNDQFGLATLPGGQAGTQPISLDAIEEIQLAIAPYDVRVSGFTGGSINAVTRSGSNQLSGSVYSYMKNQSLIGDYIEEDGTKNVYPDFTENISGARISGAIIPDKLHYFLSAELTQTTTPNTVSLDPTSAQAFRGTEEEVMRVDSVLLNRYGIATGGAKQFDAKTPNTKLLAKVDYNINKNHRLSFRQNFVDAKDDINARSTYNYYLGNAGYVFNSKQNSTMLHLYSSFGNKMSNAFTFGYTTVRDFRDEQNPNIPFFRVDGSNYSSIRAGGEQYSIGNMLDQDIIQLSNNFSYYMGSHSISLGTHNELYKSSNGFFRNFNGYYRFASVDDLLDENIKSYELTYSNISGDPQPLATLKANIIGFHAQDIWSVNKQLNLTMGVRLDIPSFPETPVANDSVAKYFGSQDIKTNQMPSGNIHISPRLGINYRLNDESNTIIRGGLGVFTGKPKFVWLSNNFSNSGMMLKSIYTSGADAIIMDLAGQYSHYIDQNAGYQTSEINVVDKDFMFPQVMRMDLAVERDLPANLRGTIEFMYTGTVNDIKYQQLNAVKQGTMKDGREYYDDYGVSSNFYHVMYVTNTNKGSHTSLTTSLDGKWNTGLGLISGNISYTYAQVKSINDLTSSQAKSNWRYSPASTNTNEPELTSSNYEIPHRFVANLSQQMKFIKNAPTTISLIYQGRSGNPFTYMQDNSSDFNNDGSKDNDALFVYDNSSQVDIVDTEGTDAFAAWAAFVDQDDYLKEFKGKLFERNAAREPWRNLMDIRITQKVNLPIIKNLELTLDILNFGNLLNSDWGKVEYVNYGTARILKFKEFSVDDDLTSTPKFEFDSTRYKKTEDVYSVNDFSSRWQMLLGLRVNF